MKKIPLAFALIIGLLTSASTLQAQTVNMSRYITLTVKKDSAIRLDLKAAATNTPVRIVSGSNTQDITVGTGWTGYRNYTAGSTTMTVYGDIISFDCSGNITKVTAIDVSHNTQLTLLSCTHNRLTTLDVSKNTQLKDLICYYNRLTSLDVSKNTQLEILDCYSNQLTSLDVSKNTQLEILYCYSNQLTSLNVSKNTQLKYLNCSSNPLSSLDVSKNTQLKWLSCSDNNFTTAALDDIYCALPNRTKEYGVIYPVYNSSSSNHATVLATNAANATAKNWKVQYSDGNVNITTTGSYVCGTPHTDIAEAAAEQALTLYPNPVADVLYLSSTARTVRVYNIDGIKVAHAADTDKVEVAHLPAGIYTVRADGTVAKMVKR